MTHLNSRQAEQLQRHLDEAVEALAASAQLCDRESRDAIANLRSIGFDIVRKGDPA